MSEILHECLYLGNIEDGNNFRFLRDKNIKCIIRILNKSDLKMLNTYEDITYYTFFLDDDFNENIISTALKAYKAFDKHQKNDNILIHCYAGQSRSVVITSYILYEEDICSTILDALEYIETRRSGIYPNVEFIQQLIDFTNTSEL